MYFSPKPLDRTGCVLQALPNDCVLIVLYRLYSLKPSFKCILPTFSGGIELKKYNPREDNSVYIHILLVSHVAHF